MDTENEENEENTSEQQVLLAISAIAEVLDTAGVPCTDTQREGIVVFERRLNLTARVQWLAQDRDDKRQQVDRSAAKIDELEQRLSEVTRHRDWLSVSRDADAKRANEAETNLSELHIQLRRMCAAESVSEALDIILAQRGAQEKLDHFVSQRDAEVDALEAKFKEQRDNALRDCKFFKKQADDSVTTIRQINIDRERWKSQCLAHERTIHELAAKVDAFESAPRFAFSTDSYDLLLRASYVIDIPTGLVIKSRKGKAHTLDGMMAASKKKRTASKTAKPKSKSKSKKR